MIDFQREDAELLSAAGFTAQQLLGRLGGGCAAGLERLRDRYQTLASAHGVSDAVRLERDRLDSLMLELHGPRGLWVVLLAVVCTAWASHIVLDWLSPHRTGPDPALVPVPADRAAASHRA